MRRWLVGLLWLLVAAKGAAADLGEAQRLYAAGNMLEAARVARAAGTADGFALAAKATLVDALYIAPAAERDMLLRVAVEDADRALELDPDHVSAMLRLAVTLGHLAEGEDLVSAHLKGYGHQGRELLERAVALRPDDPSRSSTTAARCSPGSCTAPTPRRGAGCAAGRSSWTRRRPRSGSAARAPCSTWIRQGIANRSWPISRASSRPRSRTLPAASCVPRQ